VWQSNKTAGYKQGCSNEFDKLESKNHLIFNYFDFNLWTMRCAIKILTIQFHLTTGYWLRLYLSVNLLVETIIISISSILFCLFRRLHFVGAIMYFCEHMEEHCSEFFSFILVTFLKSI
jgi:hypothetical protein